MALTLLIDWLSRPFRKTRYCIVCSAPITKRKPDVVRYKIADTDRVYESPICAGCSTQLDRGEAPK